jgi:pimeloyl-ACP methyl ester carboxylesterase
LYGVTTHRSWSLRLVLLVLLFVASMPLHARGSAASAQSTRVRSGYVLLTGIVGGEGGMKRLATRLRAEGVHVLVIDPYKESLDSADVSFAALARRVDRILDTAGITRAVVIGHAHGSAVAMRLAASYPDRVSHLFLLDAGAIAVSKTKVFSGSIKLIPYLVRIPGGRALVESRFGSGMRENIGQRSWFDKPTRRAYVSLVIDVPKAIPMASRLAQAKEPEAVSAVVARLQMPVTAILGGFPHPSGPAPAELQLLGPLGSRFRTVTLPNVGHFPHEEAPDEVVRIVRAASTPDSLRTGNPSGY